MTQLYRNSVNQVIKEGDTVIYIGWQHDRHEGEFKGLSPSGQVKIALKGGKQMYKYKWSSREKLYSRWDREIWEIYPGALMIERASGNLITYHDWAKLSYDIRFPQGKQAYIRHEGVLRDGFEEVTVPNIWYGPMGLDRTFKVE